MTLGELKQQKFRMHVNNRVYDVYPDMISISRQEIPVTKHKKEMAKVDERSSAIPLSRDLILRDYYTALVSAIKKEATTGGKITKDKLDKAFKASIVAYQQ